MSTSPGPTAKDNQCYTTGTSHANTYAQAEPQKESADRLLESLGYKSELRRNRSTAQVAFMSFVLASIPYGLATQLYIPILGGGAVTIIWGWLAVSLVTICVALSLGEITSIYPTAGGVYYQAFMLAPPSWRRLASWICGWLYTVGTITITLSVNFGTALFFVGCINVFESSPGIGIFQPTTWQLYLLFFGITLVCNAISSLGNCYLPILDTAAIFWTFAGVIAITITVLALAKNGRRDARYVFSDFEPHSGWPSGWAFMVGLLHAGYATSSTGMIISMCEEVRDPSLQVPKAMVATVIINTLAGLLFLIPLVFVLPDLSSLINIAQPFPVIVKSAVGSPGATIALCLPLLVLSILCGTGCTTAASRCTWAFSRDAAIPGSRWWKVVHPTLDVPLNAMMLSMVSQLLLGLLWFGSTAAFNAFSGVGVITLTAAYAVPVAISLFTGRRAVARARFNLGRWGAVVNVVALAWSCLAMPLFCMPVSIPVTATTVNYAPVVFVAATLVSAFWYVVKGYRDYQGPPTQACED
ncbi:polyamine transporter TPO5 [Aaosphaeria arxii CBS 175.79]|uniref:Polyamine transporter TPO5 n=1 Tax=Aaosphaeria arxii CBS 175.79 TaxID=1450172 RepID=A0A6A5X6H0_9PLEO|nr:polyamine transporter TPO5 [Aaosphaeria arxii CBS 175.79]KAF2008615.1 polyamine transporter TPO5 [Aaosphaeria arxii CBS 175.79]